MSGRAVFLFNPVAGRGLAAHSNIVGSAAAVWRSAGWRTELVATTGPGSATGQAAEIIQRGCDVLFACGGDGTVHEVLQTLVASRAQTALGILPLGTGNVVGINLGLPAATPRAAEMQLSFVPRRVAAGRISATEPDSAEAHRYFIAAAGLGLHARMMAEANSAAKQSGGMSAYYRSGFRLMFREPLVRFAVELSLPDGTVQAHECYELLAIKVRQFGGIVKRWRPGGSLLDPHLTVLMTKTASRARIFAGTMRCLIGGAPKIGGVEMIAAVRAVCRPLASADVMGEADGEVLGTLPAAISIVPDAFTLLLPG